jgi:hypothetical protein
MKEGVNVLAAVTKGQGTVDFALLGVKRPE